jgi:hypothetical protein
VIRLCNIVHVQFDEVNIVGQSAIALHAAEYRGQYPDVNYSLVVIEKKKERTSAHTIPESPHSKSIVSFIKVIVSHESLSIRYGSVLQTTLIILLKYVLKISNYYTSNHCLNLSSHPYSHQTTKH